MLELLLSASFLISATSQRKYAWFCNAMRISALGIACKANAFHYKTPLDGRIFSVNFLRFLLTFLMRGWLDWGLGLVLCLIFLGFVWFFIVALFLIENLGRVKLVCGKLEMGTAEIFDDWVVVCCINCCCCCCCCCWCCEVTNWVCWNGCCVGNWWYVGSGWYGGTGNNCWLAGHNCSTLL